MKVPCSLWVVALLVPLLWHLVTVHGDHLAWYVSEQWEVKEPEMNDPSCQSTYVQVHESDPIVSYTLFRFPWRSSLLELARLRVNRKPLQATPGLRFWRFFFVGNAAGGGLGIDLQRSALFTVWESLAALRKFEQSSLFMNHMRQRAEEVWSVHMQPVKWHGQWSGVDPFAGIPAATQPQPGPWIILTHIQIRPAKFAAFIKGTPPVWKQIWQQPELLHAAAWLKGMSTISLWRTLPAATSFAYGPATHAEVIKRTRREGWLREEVFARFRPVASWGSCDGGDPLQEFAMTF